MTDTFQALSDPRRRDIIEMLARHGEMTSTDIASNFDISAPATSQHLKVLRQAKLVDVERRAQMRIYRIHADAFDELEAWIDEMKSLWTSRFEALDSLLMKNKSRSNR